MKIAQEEIFGPKLRPNGGQSARIGWSLLPFPREQIFIVQPFNPELFQPAAISAETRAFNDALIRLLAA